MPSPDGIVQMGAGVGDGPFSYSIQSLQTILSLGAIFVPRLAGLFPVRA